MRRTTITLILVSALAVSGCSDSSLPNATGKGNIRAINAIKTSPEVAFLIEETQIGTVDFRQITATAPGDYDDLVYDFSFDVFFPGDTILTRIATQNLDVVADMNYTLLLSGTLAAPTITVWEAVERNFDGSETIFEARFAHTAESLGSVDYYFGAPGVAPVLGEEVGTLSFGEVLTSVDLTAGDFVLTATTSGDPNDVLYQSASSAFNAATQYIITTFDGSSESFAPVIGRAFTQASGVITLPDTNFPATVEFVNGSIALGTVDIYDDDLQTSLIVDDHAYMAVSPELNLAAGITSVYYTSSDSNSPVLIEDTINLFSGLRGRVVSHGPVDALAISSYVPDRRSVATHAKLQIFNTVANVEFLSLYVLDADEVFDDQLPIQADIQGGVILPTIALPADSYDFYITESGETEILAGPIRLDVALGDVIGGIIFDTVDPAVLEFGFLPNNP